MTETREKKSYFFAEEAIINDDVTKSEENTLTKTAKTWQTVVAWILFFWTGLGSWLLINGIWVQYPILVILPESYGISAYLSVSIQLANVAAVIYVIVQTIRPIPHKYTISLILVVGIITSIFLVFFWDRTAYIAGKQRSSIGLITLTFVGGMVGCASVVTFFPYAMLFDYRLVTAMSTGMGCSGLFASLLAIIQLPGDPLQTFGVPTYFWIVTGLLVGSFVSFLLIVNLPMIQQFKHRQEAVPVKYQQIESDEDPQKARASQLYLFKKGIVCISNQLVICVLWYFMLGALQWAFKNYDDSNRMLLVFGILGMIAGTLGRLASGFYKFYSVIVMTLAQVGLWIYLLVLLILYNHKLVDGWGWSIVAVYTIYSFIYGYEDTILYLRVGWEQEQENVEQVTRMVGLSNQAGSFIGSFIAFGVVVTTFSG